MTFDHIGLVSVKQRDGEFFYEPNKVWITDSEKHPFKVEWLRYEPDSPVTGSVRDLPHVGFRVDNLERASHGLKLLLGPMVIDEHKTVGFYEYYDGSIVELMEVRE